MKLLLHLIQNRSVEDTSLCEPDLLEGGDEILGLQIVVADELDAADRRSFDHGHDQCPAFAIELYVTEEPCPEQRPDRLGGERVVDAIPHLDRKIVEDGTDGDSLQSVEADVLDHERVERGSAAHEPEQHQRRESAPPNESILHL